MRALQVPVGILVVMITACSRQPAKQAAATVVTTAAAIIEVSGGKQISAVGSPLDQPVVIQVNDAQGAAVAGATVSVRSANGVIFQPASGVTGTDGQFMFAVTLGSMAGRYQISAATTGAGGKVVEARIEELALGFQQNQGLQLSNLYCARCHDSESSPERVSNYDNLTAKPHALSDGAFLNRLSDADLIAIIAHGGPALGRSAEMPPYGATLNRAGIAAIVAYMRAASDPPYRPREVVYAQR